MPLLESNLNLVDIHTFVNYKFPNGVNQGGVSEVEEEVQLTGTTHSTPEIWDWVTTALMEMTSEILLWMTLKKELMLFIGLIPR
jgi:hypothetical protein